MMAATIVHEASAQLTPPDHQSRRTWSRGTPRDGERSPCAGRLVHPGLFLRW